MTSVIILIYECINTFTFILKKKTNKNKYFHEYAAIAFHVPSTTNQLLELCKTKSDESKG